MQAVDFSNQIMDILSEEIRKEIDAGVMFDMYKELGWHPVVDCKNLSFNHKALKDVEHWLTTICAGSYHVKSHTDYIFERQDDAMMFSLKWS
jgi:hypothetical protein